MAIFAALIFLISGLISLWQAYHNHTLARASQGWARTTGQVAESALRVRKGWAISFDFAPKVSYWYKVNGLRYTGTRVTFGNNWSSLSTAESRRRRYPFGATVEVLYDPHNPRQSVLEPRAYNIGYSCTCGLVFCSATALILLSTWLGSY